MNIVIKQIDYETILTAWDRLWPGRDNSPYSSMLMLGGYDTDIPEKFKWRAWGAFDLKPATASIGVYDKAPVAKLVGVNAGHKSAPRDYRTRGLWVDPAYRGHGIAGKLFAQLEQQAENECARWLWSFPRLPSLPAYMASGYMPYGETVHADFEQNVRARKDLSVLVTEVYEQMPTDADALESAGVLLGENSQASTGGYIVTRHFVNRTQAQKHVKKMDSVIESINQLTPDHHLL